MIKAPISFYHTLTRHAEKTPDLELFHFLDDELKTTHSLTTKTLLDKSAAFTSMLKGMISHGDRVILLYDTQEDLIISFTACLLAGVIPIALPSPNIFIHNLSHSLKQLISIIENATPTLLLTTQKTASLLFTDQIQSSIDELPDTPDINLNQFFKKTCPIFITDKAEIPIVDLTSFKPSLGDTAFIQYTSGTSGVPKGVIITHDNIKNNIFNLINASCSKGYPTLKSMVSWLPLSHIMGLFSGYLYPIFTGKPAYLISPSTFLKNPLSWLQCISEYKHVISGAPHFAFALCVKEKLKNPNISFDLSSWEFAFVGSDTNHPETYQQFISLFSTDNFNPTIISTGYGLTESSAVASCYLKPDLAPIVSFDKNAIQNNKIKLAENNISANKTIDLMTIGTPFPLHDVIIVNPNTNKLCDANTVGEIWIKGPSISPGYWNNDELTASSFHGYTELQDGPYLRTGDLGFKYQDNFYLTGRIKDLMIIRGKNIAPQDIDWLLQHSLSEFPSIKVSSFSIDNNKEEVLIIAIECPLAEIDRLEEQFSFMCETVIKNFGIKIYDIIITAPNSLPITANGKIQRSKIRVLYSSQQLIIHRSLLS